MRSLVLAALLAAGSAQAADLPLTPAGPRAIWTWEGESYAMLDSEGAAAQGIAFLKAKSIGTIYLYADASRGRNLIASQPQAYRRLLRRMHASGLKVYALLGSGYLNTERYVLPRHREDALAMLQRVLDYNKAAAPEERFDGINLDIEPHILAEWSTRKMELLANFVEMSDALMRLKAASGQALPMGPAIPFWLDGIQLDWKGQRKPVSQHVQDIYDFVALMDYRDHADGGDGLVSHAMDELSYGEAIGRPVMIGIETMPNALKKVSFHHLGEADLERELAATSRSVGRMRSFGGYVVHHYAAYRRWLGLE
ncbi:hypothetical protein SRABI118_04803 [Massilia sp. Bi118]|uniref:hypothetical protein n=1 Tax=Massilia sp. Bi118 TaxID=2822346 RepID=UPI001DA0E468|nr:hypothetical protein [Massilia sp. Bi118]CAH0311329.1 hypothetical protein SRABI118_04803 [Massilia sp. Bi118]